MKAADVLKLIEEKGVRFVDLRFTDTRGKEQHVSVPASVVNEEFFVSGKMFDGSSIAGWRGIDESDMVLIPEADTAVIDVFAEETTMLLRCDVYEPVTMQAYARCPRLTAKRAIEYLRSTGIGDDAYFGPENEFFIFDDVRYGSSLASASYHVDSIEGSWNSAREFEEGNYGHRPGVKGGYFPVPPVDSLQDIRSTICLALQDLGLDVEVHHHEVATAGQGEIGVRFNSLVTKADQVQILKYAVMNTAHQFGKTATFMPKPLVGDNGNGMHVHQSVTKDGNNVFSGDGYGGLSEAGMYYIGGILKHARALNAFTNPATNSYKRLVKGFEAPTLLAYSARNRSAAVRIPFVADSRARRVEVRFPDSMANPYLAFAAMLLAGIDGIQNKIHPGDPVDKDLYDLPPEEEAGLPTVAFSLEEALDALRADNDFLKAGDVFTDDLLEGYMELKDEECTRLRATTHPVEFEMYYSL